MCKCAFEANQHKGYGRHNEPNPTRPFSSAPLHNPKCKHYLHQTYQED